MIENSKHEILKNAKFKKVNSKYVKNINDKNELNNIFEHFKIEKNNKINEFINKIKVVVDMKNKVAQVISLMTDKKNENNQIIKIKGEGLDDIYKFFSIKFPNLIVNNNKNKCWTKSRLNHMFKFGWDCYGYENLFENKSEYHSYLNNINDKLETEECVPIIQKDENLFHFYEIFNYDYEIGEIILKEENLPSNCCELDIAIYENYKGNGFAKLSIKKLLKKNFMDKYKKIIAIVRLKNPQRNKIINILVNNGFKKLKNVKHCTKWVYCNNN